VTDVDFVTAGEALILEDTVEDNDDLLLAERERDVTDERDAMLEKDAEDDTDKDLVVRAEAVTLLVENAVFDVEIDTDTELEEEGIRDTALEAVKIMLAVLVFDTEGLDEGDFVVDADSVAVFEPVDVRVGIDDLDSVDEAVEVRVAPTDLEVVEDAD